MPANIIEVNGKMEFIVPDSRMPALMALLRRANSNKPMCEGHRTVNRSGCPCLCHKRKLK